MAAFGVGFRSNGGDAGHLTVGGTTEQPTIGLTATIAPGFYYLQAQG